MKFGENLERESVPEWSLRMSSSSHCLADKTLPFPSRLSYLDPQRRLTISRVMDR